MRTCFIHIGIHKTGTTSIQFALAARDKELRTKGYHYPTTGRQKLPAGHHTIATALWPSPYTWAEEGVFDELFKEINNSNCNIILSSELFQSSVDVVIIIYLRNQVDYIASLYLELLKHAIPDTFEEFLQTALQQKAYSLRGAFFPFDYAEFIDQLKYLEGARVVARSYDDVANPSVIADFLSIIGLDPAEVGIDTGLHMNARSPLTESITAFYKNCAETSAPQIDGQLDAVLPDAVLPDAVRSDVASLSHESRRKIIKTFSPTNERLFSRYNIPPFPNLNAGDIQAGSFSHSRDLSISFEKLFSREVRDCMRRLRAAHDGETGDIQRARQGLTRALVGAVSA